MLLNARLYDLLDHGVTQIGLALEMMKEGTFRRPRFLDDVIEAAALEAFGVEFFEGGVEDTAAGIFSGISW